MSSITTVPVARARSRFVEFHLVPLDPAQEPSENTEPPSSYVRLNVNIESQIYRDYKATCAEYRLRITDVTRLALGLFLSLLPYLASGGKLVLQTSDGQRLQVSIPGLLGGQKPSTFSSD